MIIILYYFIMIIILVYNTTDSFINIITTDFNEFDIIYLEKFLVINE